MARWRDVAITAGCDVVPPMGVAGTGLVAGLVVVFGIEWINKALKMDHPVGVSGVHGMCGAGDTAQTGRRPCP